MKALENGPQAVQHVGGACWIVHISKKQAKRAAPMQEPMKIPLGRLKVDNHFEIFTEIEEDILESPSGVPNKVIFIGATCKKGEELVPVYSCENEHIDKLLNEDELCGMKFHLTDAKRMFGGRQ